MMGRTDYLYRAIVRQFSRQAALFSEMITCRALMHGPAARLLRHDVQHNPVALQLAGSEPEDFACAAPMAEAAGFSEININAGCPSKRAGSGCFGAALMRRPRLLAELVRRTVDSCSVPVSVKTRLGVDEMDSDEHLAELLGLLCEAGCGKVYLHARKALLNGISPAQNRSVPPLDYNRVATMQRRFPQLQIVLNGGLGSEAQICRALDRFGAVMVGRAAYDNPKLVAALDRRLSPADEPGPSPDTLDQRICDQWQARGAGPAEARVFVRHLMPFFRAIPQGRAVRRRLAGLAAGPEQMLAGLRALPWQQVKQGWGEPALPG